MTPPAETRSPWHFDAARRVHLLTPLPHDIGAAVAKLRAVLPQICSRMKPRPPPDHRSSTRVHTVT